MEMGDLISRKAMLEAIDERERIARKYAPDIQDDELRPTLKSIREFVNNRQAVDAEPMRHGRWIQVKTAPSYHYCSYCKSTHKMTMSCNKYVLLKYCPNCGAKMDGEDNNDRS